MPSKSSSRRKPSSDEIKLHFGARAGEVVYDLSAAARIGKTLFIASDETTALERLEPDGDGWTLAETLPLARFLYLPGGSGSEIDIEGMAIHDSWLWVVGSHALVRPRVEEDDSPRRALRRVTEIERQANRFVLARLPLVEKSPGCFVPVAEDGQRRAGQVESGKRSSLLMRWIADDPLLAPFLNLPSKENGFDVEGLAVGGGSVWLGLRGPTIRGYGVILQFDLRGNKRGALKARKLEGGRRFRKHLLPMAGLGIRDLLIRDNDLLVLGGATTMADSPHRVFRWRDALKARESVVVPEADLEPVLNLAFTAGQDAAEAICDLEDGSLLILFDRPGPQRLTETGSTYLANRVWL